MPRSAAAYLVEMDEACQFLIDRTAAMSLDEYLRDKTVRLAVERCFIILGEAMNQLHRHHPAIGSVFMERPESSPSETSSCMSIGRWTAKMSGPQ